ncbi:TonB-dependent receptor plug domain-containing protein [Massilia sp. H6]|uniref:TonB-dependent receptor plug domain-containing protein n=1 Tax=Massilia sp. H6 TaxID=2970464 RepID=UPI0027D96456|nr:TonB-dependent receptor plug domain-containing protein [Massilia sp. H6]
MHTIKSRKHRHSPVMGTVLAAVSMPIAAHANEVGIAAADNIAPATTVEIVGKAGNAVRAEYASSPKYTEKLVDTAQSVQVITKELYEQQGALTLTEALRNTPGVGAFFLGENGNTNTGDAIFMRGFDTSGSIFVDGVRDVGSVSRDVFNLEQIDVVKGPAGTDNGRGSPTGSVNLVSKKAHMARSANASLTGGSAAQKRATADLNTVLDGETGVALRLNVLAQDAGNPARDVVNSKRWALGAGAEPRFRPERPDPRACGFSACGSRQRSGRWRVHTWFAGLHQSRSGPTFCFLRSSSGPEEFLRFHGRLRPDQGRHGHRTSRA